MAHLVMDDIVSQIVVCYSKRNKSSKMKLKFKLGANVFDTYPIIHEYWEVLMEIAKKYYGDNQLFYVDLELESEIISMPFEVPLGLQSFINWIGLHINPDTKPSNISFVLQVFFGFPDE